GRLVAPALVAGAMAPDAPYYLNTVLPAAFGYGRITHSPLAVPTLDVALAACLVAVWQLLLREPLVALLPEPWAGRAHALTAPTARRGRWGAGDAAWFALSGAIGAATHVGIDAFTHPNRAGSRIFPQLNQVVLADLPLYRLLQYSGSAVGLAVLA